jgi:hypothetical protein
MTRLVWAGLNTITPDEIAENLETDDSLRLPQRRMILGRAGSLGTLALVLGIESRNSAYARLPVDSLPQLLEAHENELADEELRSVWTGFRKSSHLLKLVSTPDFASYQEAGKIARMLDESQVPSGFRAVRHVVEDGGRLDAVSLEVGTLVFGSYDWGNDEASSNHQLNLFQIIDNKRVRRIAEVKNGTLSITSANFAADIGQPCTQQWQCGICEQCRCTEMSEDIFEVMFNCCAACVFACSNPISCMACSPYVQRIGGVDLERSVAALVTYSSSYRPIDTRAMDFGLEFRSNRTRSQSFGVTLTTSVLGASYVSGCSL